MPSPDGPLPSADDELGRMIREGVRPTGTGDRLRLALDKMTGRAPLGVDAPNATARKLIGGGGELLAALKFGFFALLLGILGLGFVWAGLQEPRSWKTGAWGAGMLLLALLSGRTCYRAVRNVKAITRA
jgi:hypothetical protein